LNYVHISLRSLCYYSVGIIMCWPCSLPWVGSIEALNQSGTSHKAIVLYARWQGIIIVYWIAIPQLVPRRGVFVYSWRSSYRRTVSASCPCVYSSGSSYIDQAGFWSALLFLECSGCTWIGDGWQSITLAFQSCASQFQA